MTGSAVNFSRRAVVLGTAVSACILTVSGCRSTLESPNPFVSRQVRVGASGSTASAVIHVRVPVSQTNVTQLVVSDSVYVQTPVGTPRTFKPSQCELQGQEHVCTATFSAPLTTNDVLIDSYDQQSKLLASGTFPLAVSAKGATDTAVLGGTIKKLAVVPFLGPYTPPSSPPSYLPLSQNEGAWVVARDSQNSVIVGDFQPPITLHSGVNQRLIASPVTIGSSKTAENVNVYWRHGYYRSTYGVLKATTPSVESSPVPVNPASDIIYFQPQVSAANLSPGPVVVGNDGAVYFAVNDATGCSGSPRACNTQIWRFDPFIEKFTPSAINVSFASGIKQMFVDPDGAIWMSTYQTTGPQFGDLPVLRLPPNQFAQSKLERLPQSFGQASGFAIDPFGYMWISRCKGDCSGSNGAPMVAITPIEGSHKAPVATVSLPRPCGGVGGSGGVSVGDIALAYKISSYATFYVIGHSSPPGNGALWTINEGAMTSGCDQSVPAGFNPGPYFAKVGGALVMGASGTGSSAHGFYVLSNGSISVHSTPRGTATYLSPTGDYLYYTANGADSSFDGVGTYKPSTGKWNVFSTATLANSPIANGVAGTDQGAWFTALATCGDPPKQGVCLGRAVYLPAFGAIPQLQLGDTNMSQPTRFGVFTNPQPSSSPDVAEQPFNVHSGPFKAQSQNPQACTVELIAPFTWQVHGVQKGPCPLTITNTKTGQVQPLVTEVQ